MSETCVFCGQELTKDDEERLKKIGVWNNKGFNSCKACMVDLLRRERRKENRILESLKEELEFLESIGKREAGIKVLGDSSLAEVSKR